MSQLCRYVVSCTHACIIICTPQPSADHCPDSYYYNITPIDTYIYTGVLLANGSTRDYRAVDREYIFILYCTMNRPVQMYIHVVWTMVCIGGGWSNGYTVYYLVSYPCIYQYLWK